MSQSSSNRAEAKTSPAQKINGPALLTAIAATILIGTEIWLAALASLWAADGVFGLSITGDVILAALIAPPALWATWKTAQLAISAEMDPENRD